MTESLSEAGSTGYGAGKGGKSGIQFRVCYSCLFKLLLYLHIQYVLPGSWINRSGVKAEVQARDVNMGIIIT